MWPGTTTQHPRTAASGSDGLTLTRCRRDSRLLQDKDARLAHYDDRARP